MAKKDLLYQSGITIDNKPVYSGIYSFYETHGIPLDVIFALLNDNGIVPNWTDLYLDAKKAGMSHDRIVSKLEESISDSLGKEWVAQVIPNLNKIFNND